MARRDEGTAGLQGDRDGIPVPRLFTIGHATLSSEQAAPLVTSAGVQLIVDSRSAPGSRSHPHFGRLAIERWLPATGIAYRWKPDLGGHRRPVGGSANTALRHPTFRGYAEYTATAAFAARLRRLLHDARVRPRRP